MEEILRYEGTKYSRFNDPVERQYSSLIKVTYASGDVEYRTPESYLMTDDGKCRRCGKEVYYEDASLKSEETGKRHMCRKIKQAETEDDDEA